MNDGLNDLESAITTPFIKINFNVRAARVDKLRKRSILGRPAVSLPLPYTA